jgi:antitoxin YefM
LDQNSGHGENAALSEVKAKLSQVVDEVATTHERVIVTRNGKPAAVLVGADDLEAIEETIAILSDDAAMRSIAQACEAIRSGDVYSRTDIEQLRDRLLSEIA